MALHTPQGDYYGDAAKTGPNDTPETRVCKLFIGSLSPTTSPEMLTLYFSRYGSVEAATVKRDIGTGVSRGFGFIKMGTEDMAKKILDASPHSVDGRVIDVRKVVADDPTCKIFVGGLTFATTNEMLHKYFTEYGTVLDASIRRSGDGKPRGFGFVLFEQVQSVDAILNSGPHFLDGKQIDPKRVFKDASEADNGASVPKLFIGGLTLHTAKETLQKYYSQFGNVSECNIVIDPQTGKSRGFGFVRFGDPDSLERAMAERPHNIDGKTVAPRRVLPSQGAGGVDRLENLISVKNLFVGGLKGEHTEPVLREYFGQFGNVLEVKYPTKGVQSGRDHRGFAFVDFDDYDSVDRVILQPSHVIAGYDVDVRKGLTREEMEKVEQLKRDREIRDARSNANTETDGLGSYGGPGGLGVNPGYGQGWPSSLAGAGGLGVGFSDGYDPRSAYVGGGAGGIGALAEQYAGRYGGAGGPGMQAAGASVYSYGYGAGGRPDLPGYGSGPQGVAGVSNGASYKQQGAGPFPIAGGAGQMQPGGMSGAMGGGGLKDNKFKELLLSSGVSPDAVSGLERENLLDASVLAALTMREFEQLPLSMGDRKRIEITLKSIRGQM